MLAHARRPVYAGQMNQVINIIGPTIFVIVVGYLFGRVSRAGIGTLIDVAMFIATPCLVFSSMFSSEIQMGEALRLWASCLLIMGGTFLVAWLALGLGRKVGTGIYLPVIFANLINIPLPIIYLAFGQPGVAKAVLFYIPNGLLVYSLGVYIASGHKEWRQGIKAVLRTPLIYAAILGLVLNVTGVPVPQVFVNAFKFMGQAAVPLMLLVLGMNIGHFRFRQIRLTLGASAIRMGGGFLIGLLCVWLFGLTDLPRAIVLFESAMPSAIFVAVLCTKFDNEAELVSSIVLATTMLAVGVIPALLYYLT
jgi:malate permease and related proteins